MVLYTAHKGDVHAKGSFRLTCDTQLRMAQPGDPVSSDACTAVKKYLPEKPFLLEITGTIVDDVDKETKRTFYLSFATGQIRKEMTDELNEAIAFLKEMFVAGYSSSYY